MQDNQLIELFLPIINAALLADGYQGVNTKQSYQPTIQGVNTGPTVYFYKISDRRYGFLRRTDVWDIDALEMVHSEVQQYTTTFQVSALVRQNPSNVNTYTASDLVNEVAAIMQSDSTRQQLRAKGVYILRVEDIANPYFSDDRDQFEASPSFDFTLTHDMIRVSTIQAVDSVTLDIQRV